MESEEKSWQGEIGDATRRKERGVVCPWYYPRGEGETSQRGDYFGSVLRYHVWNQQSKIDRV